MSKLALRPELHVVVADDDRDTTDSFAQLLAQWGHKVRCAYDGAEALDLIVAERPDVLMADLAMPKFDGLRLARRLRGEIRFASILLIAVTGYADDEHRRATGAAGFDHFFHKPADLAALNQLLLAERYRRAVWRETPDCYVPAQLFASTGLAER